MIYGHINSSRLSDSIKLIIFENRRQLRQRTLSPTRRPNKNCNPLKIHRDVFNRAEILDN